MTITMVWPPSAIIWKVSATFSLLARSRLPVGSSTQDDGRFVGQGAGDGDRCCSPPERRLALRLILSASPAAEEHMAAAPAPDSLPSRPSLNIGKATFSWAVNSLRR